MSEEVKIIDKVKFWEEQDNINNVLIPRVLAIHENLKSTSLLAQKNSSDYVQMSELIKLLQQDISDLTKSFKNKSKAQQDFNKNTEKSMSDFNDRLHEFVGNFEEKLREQQGFNGNIERSIDVIKKDLEIRHQGLIVELMELKGLVKDENEQLLLKIDVLSDAYQKNMNETLNAFGQYSEEQKIINEQLKITDKANQNNQQQIVHLKKQLESLKSGRTQEMNETIMNFQGEIDELYEYQAVKHKIHMAISGIAIVVALIAVFMIFSS